MTDKQPAVIWGLVLTNDVLAQMAHVGWGAFFTLIFAMFHHVYIGMLSVVVGTSIKEFIIDKYVEKQAFADNIKDFGFWSSGIGLGYLVAVIANCCY